jgi:hypothetical protein
MKTWTDFYYPSQHGFVVKCIDTEVREVTPEERKKALVADIKDAAVHIVFGITIAFLYALSYALYVTAFLTLFGLCK